jgi:hypothetical protein
MVYNRGTKVFYQLRLENRCFQPFLGRNFAMRYFRFALASFLCGSALALAACGSEPADAQLGLSSTAHAATVEASAPATTSDLSTPKIERVSYSSDSGVSAGVGEAAVYGPGGTLCVGNRSMLRKVERAGEEAPLWLRRDIAKCDFYASHH